MNHATWIVLADSSRARIFRTDAALTEGPVVIDELVHPASRLRGRELESDRPSRSFAERGAHPSDLGESGAHAHQSELFAMELADHLDAARKDGRYEGIVLAAPPRFLGALRKAMSPATLDLVHQAIDKELTQLPEHAVLAALRQRIDGAA
ncbi:host attachment protein [Myxococcota bacterium]|nr:host attachment protein [Myxococcota bacterium]